MNQYDQEYCSKCGQKIGGGLPFGNQGHGRRGSSAGAKSAVIFIGALLIMIVVIQITSGAGL